MRSELVMPTRAPRRAYDHLLSNFVALHGPEAVKDAKVPRSTVAGWVKRGPRSVVSSAVFEQPATELIVRVARLERTVAVLVALLRLVLTLVRVRGARLDGERLPDGADKAVLLAAIERARAVVPRRSALKVVGLTESRYRSWKRRTVSCTLDDGEPCPKTQPSKLTSTELFTMRDLVTSTEHRHMPLRALALYAQRIGRVFAAPATWARTARQYGWKRSRVRVHPRPPRVGVRAERPGQMLHVDVTILRLLDGTKAYLQAVIDNFSRKILCWRLTERFEPTVTATLLGEAAELLPEQGAGNSPATVVADSGVENVNGAVDAVLRAAGLRRLLAQVDVAFSNSMIEAWWRSLKHNWLFLNQLDSLATLRRLVAFYVEQHNSIMPHAAFDGRTPDELFDGRANGLHEQLGAAHAAALAARIASNRKLTCSSCHVPAHALDPPGYSRLAPES